MTGRDEQERFVASCTECGSVYAALKHSDGEIVPIGKPDGCTCGGTVFSRVTDAAERNSSFRDDPTGTD